MDIVIVGFKVVIGAFLAIVAIGAFLAIVKFLSLMVMRFLVDRAVLGSAKVSKKKNGR